MKEATPTDFVGQMPKWLVTARKWSEIVSQPTGNCTSFIALVSPMVARKAWRSNIMLCTVWACFCWTSSRAPILLVALKSLLWMVVSFLHLVILNRMHFWIANNFLIRNLRQDEEDFHRFLEKVLARDTDFSSRSSAFMCSGVIDICSKLKLFYDPILALENIKVTPTGATNTHIWKSTTSFAFCDICLVATL